MLITPLVMASVALTKEAIRKVQRKRNLREENVDPGDDPVAPNTWEAAALAQEIEDARTGRNRNNVTRRNSEPGLAPNAETELLASMTLAPQPTNASSLRPSSSPARPSALATPSQHINNTSSYDEYDEDQPSSGAATHRRTSSNATYINPNLPPAPWYLSPPELNEYKRIQMWTLSWGLPMCLPSSTPSRKGFSWRKAWERPRGDDGLAPRFLVNADGAPDPYTDYARADPSAIPASPTSSSASLAIGDETSTRRPSHASSHRSPSPVDQNWLGVSVHSNSSITFRRRIPSPLGYGGRTCVADKPVNVTGRDAGQGFYFEVLISEFGAGKANPALVTTVGLGARGDEAVDLLTDRMMLGSSSLTREEAREIAQVVVREEEETRSRIRRAVTGVSGDAQSTSSGSTTETSTSSSEPARKPSIISSIWNLMRADYAPPDRARQAYAQPKPTTRRGPKPPPNPNLQNDFKLCIGLVTRPYPPMVLPGFFPTSVALVYSPYEGLYVASTLESEGGGRTKERKIPIDRACAGTATGPEGKEPCHLTTGDTVGVGFDPARGVFFTINGRRLDIPSKKQPNAGCVRVEVARDASLFPAIGSNGACQALANFGSAPFVWDGTLPTCATVKPAKKLSWNQTFGEALETEIGEGDRWFFGDERSPVYGAGRVRDPPAYSIPSTAPPSYDEI